MVNTMGWNERSDPDMRTANFCDVYREGVYTVPHFKHNTFKISKNIKSDPHDS